MVIRENDFKRLSCLCNLQFFLFRHLIFMRLTLYSVCFRSRFPAPTDSVASNTIVCFVKPMLVRVALFVSLLHLQLHTKHSEPTDTCNTHHQLLDQAMELRGYNFLRMPVSLPTLPLPWIFFIRLVDLLPPTYVGTLAVIA